MENLLPRGMLGSSRRSILAGVGALVLATILLLVYLSHYRSSVKGAGTPVTVLRAKAFIPQGTTALAAANKGLYESVSIPKSQLADGAVTDARVLHGEVALDDVYPGQQLTTSDFGVSATSSALSGSPDLLGSKGDAGTWRALSISLDAAHGIMPQAQTGDHVDVYAQVGGIMGLLLPDVYVLAAPNQAASGTAAPTSQNYILRVPTKDAPKFAYAADNGKIWFALRPQKGAHATPRALITSTNFFSRG